MKIIVLTIVFFCAGALHASDPLKAAIARENRKSELAARRELIVSIAMSDAAGRRERIRLRKERPVYFVYVPYAVSRGGGSSHRHDSFRHHCDSYHNFNY
jgi:hypothetical protein